GDARGAEAEIAEDQADDRVDRIEVRRDERALEQRKMDEAYRDTEEQHVERHVPPRPPGRRNRASREICGAPTHDDGHEQEETRVVFLVKDALHQLVPLRSGMIWSENRFPLFGIMPAPLAGRLRDRR